MKFNAEKFLKRNESIVELLYLKNEILLLKDNGQILSMTLPKIHFSLDSNYSFEDDNSIRVIDLCGKVVKMKALEGFAFALTGSSL